MLKIFNNLTKKQKISIFLVTALILFTIAYSIFTLFSRHGKIATIVQYAPYSATVKVNGKIIPNKSRQYLEPGEYQVEVSLEHFETFTNTVTISSDFHYLVGILNASDDIGKKYISDHQLEFTEAEGLVGQALDTEGLNRKKQFPILNYLPINNSLYSISYAYDTDNVTPIISVKATALYLDDAVAKLKTLKNVDLTSYDIVFKTTNPFSIYDASAKGNTPAECAKQAFNLPSNYTMTNGQDLTDNYYSLQFYIDDYRMDYQYSHYRVLFHRGEDKLWKIVSTPQPLLTQKNTPNTPKVILDSANSL